jgi:hypothetical protein
VDSATSLKKPTMLATMVVGVMLGSPPLWRQAVVCSDSGVSRQEYLKRSMSD